MRVYCNLKRNKIVQETRLSGLCYRMCTSYDDALIKEILNQIHVLFVSHRVVKTIVRAELNIERSVQ